MAVPLLLWILCPLRVATAQSSTPETATLIIHITGKEYDALNLIFNSEGQRNYICRGLKTDANTWRFTYPQSIYPQHQYVKLSVKEEIPDKTIGLRTFLYDKPLISEMFGIPSGSREFTLTFYKTINNTVPSQQGTFDLFYVKDPDFETFCELKYFFLLTKCPYRQFLSETLKAIRESSDSIGERDEKRNCR